MFETQWDGYVLQATEASEACAGGCAGPCGLRVPPVGTAVEFSLGLAGALECGEQCECEANSDGWCEAPGGPLEFPEIVTQAVEWPPACPVVEVYL